MKGTWDSIHVVEVTDQKKNGHYKLTSTVMLTVETETEATGMVRLAGSLTRQQEQDFPVSDQNPHITNIGRMVEDMELKLRTTIDIIYFGKTKEVFKCVFHIELWLMGIATFVACSAQPTLPSRRTCPKTLLLTSATSLKGLVLRKFRLINRVCSLNRLILTPSFYYK